ncbi:MAG: DnaB-like helicase C-terminal domain-containing protein [Chitinophagaceae bacterium]
MSVLDRIYKAQGAAPETAAPAKRRPAQALVTTEEAPKFNPVLGFKLLLSIATSNDIPAFKSIDARHLHFQELDAYNFCSNHLNRFHRLPEVETMRTNGFLLDVTPSQEPPAYFISRIAQREVLTVMQTTQPAITRALTSNATPDEVIALCRDQLTALHAIRSGAGDTQSFHSLLLEVMQEHDRARMNPGMVGVPMGYPTLDLETGGAMPGELVCYVGRPGVGKTIMLSEAFIANYLAGKRCLICSNEMPGRQLARRLLGRLSKINHQLIKKGQVSTLGQRRLHRTIQFVSSGPEAHFLTGSFNQTMSELDKTVQAFAPDVLFVDAAYLLKKAGLHKHRDEKEIQQQIVRDLKGMTLGYNIPGFVTYQLNRSEKDRVGKRHKADLSALAGTDSIGQDADIIAALLRPPMPFSDIYRLVQLMKARDAEKVDFAINFDFDTQDFSETPIADIMGSDDDDDDEPSTSNFMIG